MEALKFIIIIAIWFIIHITNIINIDNIINDIIISPSAQVLASP